jgi:farnesyl-diphosphate farnesyltransferase
VVVGNAYLLCRIADTIEDSPALSMAEKRRFCDEFVRVVEGAADSVEFAAALSRLLTRGILDAERDLVANTPRVIRLTRSFRPEERAALTRCVRIMAGGMEEFQEGNFQHGLTDLAHLDAYCYHVAGVVGELLCELFCAYSERIARRRDDLMRLAVSFGQGLQMTNILKDIWDDKGRGVCWLPRSVFAAHGFDLRDLGKRELDAGYRDGLMELVGIARSHLENALKYTLLIPKDEPGIRRFCLWAIGMALLTLRRIRRNPYFTSGDEVKISRRSVRLVLLASNAACNNDTALRALFAVGAAGLPRADKGGHSPAT